MRFQGCYCLRRLLYRSYELERLYGVKDPEDGQVGDMHDTRPKTRLFVTDGLATGARIILPSGESHHLVTVLRGERDTSVALFNGRDGEWRARLVKPDRKAAGLEVEERLRPQTVDSGVWLAFAPIKRAKTDLIVEKATELGAARLIPVKTARSIVERVKHPRLETIARKAAAQCDRLTVPEITASLTLDALLEGWPRERRLFFCEEGGVAPPLLSLLQSGQGGPGPAALLIGPEGGVSDHERARLRGHPGVAPASLGRHILRAETAAIAALAIFEAARGTASERLQS